MQMEILVHLIDKYKDVIENKKTDAVTTSMKNEGWNKLTEEFNSISSFCVRNTDQLKTCWDNIKRITRKDKAATKKQVLLTGGGRSDIPPPGPLQGQVEILLGPTLDGLENPYDSDIQYSAQGLSNPTEVTETQDEQTDINEAGPSQISQLANKNTLQGGDGEKIVWSSWTPAALKTKVAAPLTIGDTPSTWIHRRRPKTSLQDKILQSKLELVELMKRNAETEGKIKEEQLKQEKLKTAKLQAELDEINFRNVNMKPVLDTL